MPSGAGKGAAPTKARSGASGAGGARATTPRGANRYRVFVNAEGRVIVQKLD